jgi:repressor of nif and glnA expression
MKNYNLTIYKPKKNFVLDSFIDEFSNISDTEPLMTEVGDSIIMIFGSDVDLVDLATVLSSILFDTCYGYTLVEIVNDYAAFFPMENFVSLGLNDAPNEFSKGNKPFLGILKSDNLTKVYSVINEGESETDLDLILEKISSKGISSLTSIEKELLQNFSKQN